MTPPAPFPITRQAGRSRVSDRVIDADFVVIPQPPAVPQKPRPLVPASVASPARSERAGPGFWLAGVLVAILAFLAAGGHSLWTAATGDHTSQMRGSFALRTLDVRAGDGGRPGVVAIEAQVRNASDTAHAMPLLAIRLVTGDGRRLDHPLPRRNAVLAPGASERFATRIAVPEGSFVSAQAVFVD